MDEGLDEFSVLGSEHFLGSQLLLESLLLKGRLHLIFVFNGLSSLLLLLRHALLVTGPSHFTHLLFLLQTLLVTLELQLYLVFGTSLGHLGLVLSGLALLLLLDLRALNLELLGILRQLKLLGGLTLQCQIKCLLGI